MASIGDIVAHLRLDNRDFTRNANATTQQTGRMSSLFSVMARSAGSAAAGLAGIGAASSLAFKAFSTSQGFERALTRSTAIQQTSIEQQQRMREEALRTSAATQFSATEAAEAYFFLASAGLNAEEQIASLSTVAKFAQAGNFDLALATDLLTDAQSALGLSTGTTGEKLANLTRVGDTLVKANTLANASVEQFATALTSGAAAAARDVGMSLAETVSVLAVFADQGIKAENAGTQFSIVMRDLQTKALGNKEAFRAAGIAVFDSAGEFRSMSDIIGDIENRLGGMSDAAKKAELLTLGFSDKSVAAIQKLLGTSDKLKQFYADLEQAGGTIDDVASRSLTKLDESLNKLNAQFERFSQTTVPPVVDELAFSLEEINRRIDVFTAPETGPVDMLLGALGLTTTLEKIEPAKPEGPVTSSPNEKLRQESVKALGPVQLPGFELGSSRIDRQKPAESVFDRLRAVSDRNFGGGLGFQGFQPSAPPSEQPAASSQAMLEEAKKQTALLEQNTRDTVMVKKELQKLNNDMTEV